ncbi:hypothetical protein ABIA55_002245 [Pseudomonas frederiksbergensis]|jgi:hypothetical protein
MVKLVCFHFQWWAHDRGTPRKLPMRSSQIRVAHSTKSSESLSLQPVSQRSRSSIRFVRQRSPQRATVTWRRHQHQNLCFLRSGVTRVLRALWFDVILVTISRRIFRLGFDSIGHARHALHASKTKTCLCRRRSPLVHTIQIMSPRRLTVSARFSAGRDRQQTADSVEKVRLGFHGRNVRA